MEDLWAFNEEVVARAIFDSKIPVISAVGHEIDTTIADLVADARASTPTKAGVVAVPDKRDVLAHLDDIAGALRRDIRSRLELAEQSLRTLLASAVFRNPLLPVNNARQRLDDLTTELIEVTRRSVLQGREKLQVAFQRVLKIEPHRLIGQRRVQLGELKSTVRTSVRSVLGQKRLQLAAAESSLRALNPRSVLNRGYSITTDKKTGRVIRKADDVRIDDVLRTELASENFIESKVTKKQNKQKE